MVIKDTKCSYSRFSIRLFCKNKCLSQVLQTIAIPTLFSIAIAGALNASGCLVDYELGVVRPGYSKRAQTQCHKDVVAVEM